MIEQVISRRCLGGAQPLDLRRMVFYSEGPRFGFAAVVETFETVSALLAQPAARFAGDPLTSTAC